MINSMDKAKKNGQMELNTKEIINMVKKMDLENFCGLICHLIKGIFMTTIFMVMVNINGLMEENTSEIGYVIKCMEKVFSHGKMGGNIKETIMMIKNRDMEYSPGLMVDNTMDNGIMENKMEQEYIIIQDKKYVTVYGKMERELNG